MNFKEFIDNNLVLFDGAMGTELQKKGLKLGDVPETLNIEQRDMIVEIHKEYIEAGSNVVTTNTFGANEKKLQATNYSVEEIIDAAVKAAREAIGNKDVFAALDIGPIGELVEPMGILTFDEAYEIFKRQVVQGEKSGADLILIETMTDLYEMKAALLAAKENTTLPVLATMSFEKDHRTFTGCLPSSMAVTLEGLGADGIGINCSLEPKEIRPIVEELMNWTNLPVLVQANAGLPSVIDGKTHYEIGPEEYSDDVLAFIGIGVSMLGGCCGTSPEYIREIKKKINRLTKVERAEQKFHALCTPSNTVLVEGVKVIGERINPTGKKMLKEALKNSDMDYILKQGVSQVEAGAEILDVNVGLREIDQNEMMMKVVKGLQSVTNAPLQIDSSDMDVIEAGLRYANGKAIVNSVNGEDQVLERILPLVKKYGAAVVGLTLDERGIPDNALERFKIAEKILNKALEYGIKKEDVYIDTLTLTCSAQQKEVAETIKTLTMVKEKLGLKTVLGVSNISFGMPNRPLINETFLAIAMAAGLDLPIINPNDENMMDKVYAFNVLYNHDKGSIKYIERYGDKSSAETSPKKEKKEETLYDMVVKGLKENAAAKTKLLLSTKTELEIVNEFLIPALDVVGSDFEKGVIFLPQLIQSAETVKSSFDVLKESLNKNESDGISNGKIILATVRGDIHDIGKNIVKVILENYNYDIIDLGKDVSADKIVEEAKKYTDEPIIVGLSALMTTTMKSMEDIIEELRDNGIDCPVMVGGAVLTAEYAKNMGADYYAKDAKEAVEIARKVFNN
ncbi:homocysteine S-methyltransferase family protein [Sedimentibacter saalensis]|uniref:homocysteine S-methyltransferase family protein n=1 Tax=Sedimentibacter saalensis TaxID=130788 RepID=UPI00289F09C0|nr:homocysteine S-methyltransferase family protein [Sedimentibacter saalensis]MEA5096101.1 homocysteine S-methyltransferase family protein [Sedimentibacter saalensis]